MKPSIRLAPPAAFVVSVLIACGGGDSGSADAGGGQVGDTPPAAQPAPPSAAGGIDASRLPQGVTVAMVEEGKIVFEGPGICYTCHTAAGTGGPLAPDLTDDTWINIDGEYQSIIGLVNTGVPQPLEHPGAMLPRAGMPLTDAQVSAVSAYAYMLSRM